MPYMLSGVSVQKKRKNGTAVLNSIYFVFLFYLNFFGNVCEYGWTCTCCVFKMYHTCSYYILYIFFFLSFAQIFGPCWVHHSYYIYFRSIFASGLILFLFYHQREDIFTNAVIENTGRMTIFWSLSLRLSLYATHHNR